MLNHQYQPHPLAMTPEGSLNSLLVPTQTLHPLDPLLKTGPKTAVNLVSRQAFVELLVLKKHPIGKNLRQFLTDFSIDDPFDSSIFELFAKRFLTVIKTARSRSIWLGTAPSPFQSRLAEHWANARALVISGGLTTSDFGIELASYVERKLHTVTTVASPWGGLTALYGLAQTTASKDPLLVLDFGATGIKRGIAINYGNRINHLPDLKASHFKNSGLISDNQFIDILKQTRQLVDIDLPVAISLACYLNKGHPFNYTGGIYHRLGAERSNLTKIMGEEWLPKTGFGDLALLEHDSTAAALAFKFSQPAMMVTLGTGLGSAPCPEG